MDAVDEQLEQEVQLLHMHICEGLGDPKRVLILYLLAERPRNVTELTELLAVSQPTVSHHLKILRDRGLVQTEREGTTVNYSLADHRIIDALDLLRGMLADILAQRAALCAVSL
ncbi:MAG: winged helix-turn-helix transcriptional regulator [Anaerolineae bacterium]|nr:winged helix-turn-helix transcriptional regulator [Anaerolineae bacterium]